VAAARVTNTDVRTREGAYGRSDDPNAVVGWKGVAIDFPRVHDVTDSPVSDEQLACLPIAYGTATGRLERANLGAVQQAGASHVLVRDVAPLETQLAEAGPFAVIADVVGGAATSERYWGRSARAGAWSPAAPSPARPWRSTCACCTCNSER